MQRMNPFENVLNVHNVKNLKVKWSYTTGGNVGTSPALANGVVYVGSADGNLYAFGLLDGGQSKQATASQRSAPKALRPDFSLKPSKPVATQSVAKL